MSTNNQNQSETNTHRDIEHYVPVPNSDRRLEQTAGGQYRIVGPGHEACVVNDSAAVAWGFFNGESSFREIARDLKARLGIDQPLARISDDLVSLARHLHEVGLVELAPPGTLPDFLIVGAQKAGTSTLQHNLAMHPQAYMPGNELHFFDNDANWNRGKAWYLGHFTEAGRLQGEKTPDYLSSEKSIERIRSLAPEARLIVLLREPVSRAYSAWNHFNSIPERSSRWGWVVCDFETSLVQNESLLRKGRYAEQLEVLFRYFPRESVYIGIAERFRRDGAREFARVCDFLGIPRVDRPYEARHVRPYAQPISETTRHRLLAYYRPFNADLFELLGERIQEWSED